MKSKLKMIGSMAVFGTLSLFVKEIELTSKEIAFFRAVIAFCFLSLVLLVRKLYRSRKPTGSETVQKDGTWKNRKQRTEEEDYEEQRNEEQRNVQRKTGKQVLCLLLSGGLIGLNWICLFEAYNFVPVSIATLCYYVQPILVLLFSAVLFREHLHRKQVLCFVVSTIGLLCVLNVTGGNVNLTGVAFGLGAAVLYACVVLMNKAVKNMDDMEKTVWQFLGAIVTVLPYILLTGGFSLSALTTGGLVRLLVLGIFHTGICYCLYFSSIEQLTGQQVSIYGYIDPLVAILISFTILQERTEPIQMLGGALILGATFVNEWTWQGRPKKSRNPEED